MKKLVIALVVALCLGFLPVMSGAANATEIAVVDVNKILTDSTPAKAGEEHLKKVQEILQKGLNDVIELYKGKENTPEAQQDVAQAYSALNQQMAIEQQAVRQVLEGLLIESAKEWRAKNTKYDVVMNSALLMDFNNKMDATAAVLKIFNTKKADFPALPQVTVNKPAAQ